MIELRLFVILVAMILGVLLETFGDGQATLRSTKPLLEKSITDSPRCSDIGVCSL